MFSYLKKAFSKTSSSTSSSKSGSKSSSKSGSKSRSSAKTKGNRHSHPGIASTYAPKSTAPAAKVRKVTPSNRSTLSNRSMPSDRSTYRSTPSNRSTLSNRSTPSNSMLLGSPVLHIADRFTNQLKYGMNDEAKAEYGRLSRSEPNWANMSEADRVHMARKPQMDKQLPHAYINNPSTPDQKAIYKATGKAPTASFKQPDGSYRLVFDGGSTGSVKDGVYTGPSGGGGGGGGGGGTSGGPLIPMPIGKNPNYDASGGIPYGTGNDPFTQAANLALMGTKLSIDEQRRQFDETQKRLTEEDARRLKRQNKYDTLFDERLARQDELETRFIQSATSRAAVGDAALNQQKALLGLSGADAQAQATAQFQESPGQKFLRERQERALMRNASAMGGLGGGNVRTALQEQAAGIANQQFGQYQDQLNNLSLMGAQAGGTVAPFLTERDPRITAQSNAVPLASLASGKSNAVSNLYNQGGQARASGILGQQQANAARSTRNNQMLMGVLGGGLAGSGIFGPQMQQSVGGNFITGALLGLL